MPTATTISHSKNPVQLLVSRRVRWTFDVDHATIVETHIVLLTVVRTIVLLLRNIRQTCTYVISGHAYKMSKCQPHICGTDGNMEKETNIHTQSHITLY